ncbi:MAG TPA: ferrochelatase, partial [Acidimicrobiales bacterium]|nr:ferrochelatase [Acidimicrobiales bacterium]
SAYSSYSGCRQYLENMERARAEVGPGAPELVKLRPYYDHPGFVAPLADGLRAALAEAAPAGTGGEAGGGATRVLMTAHSIPEAQAATCAYESQLQATGAQVAARAGLSPGTWDLVYQSRSGPPTQPWLGPDIITAIDEAPASTSVVIAVPIGFVSDHMEVVYDLDVQAAEAARRRGVGFLRTATPGVDPRFVAMVSDLVDEAEAAGPGPAAGSICATPGCCPPPAAR